MIAPRDPAAAVTSSEGSPPLPYLLNIAYLLLIFFSLPWLVVQAVRKGKYREGYAAKFLGLVPRRSGDRVCVWLHAVSVGEVNLLAPLLRTIRQQRPDWECVVSTTTATGMALAKKKYADLCVFYCPLDFSWAVRAAMRRIRPDALLLAELELWPNLVRAARENGARVAVINGRLSERSFVGYRRIRFLAASLLRRIDLLAVQDEVYAERFLELGRAFGVGPHDRLDEVRRGADRQGESDNATAGGAGRLPRRGRGLPGRQHPGTGGGRRGERLPAIASRLAAASLGPGPPPSGAVRVGGPAAGRRGRRLATTDRLGPRRDPTPPPGSFWSMSLASWAAGGERRESRLSAAAWATAAGRT